VRPSLKTLDATEAILAEVRSLGALLCVSALAAALLEFLLVDALFRTFAAALATLELVPLFIQPSGYLHILRPNNQLSKSRNTQNKKNKSIGDK
jgi:hypothetical protein